MRTIIFCYKWKRTREKNDKSHANKMKCKEKKQMKLTKTPRYKNELRLSMRFHSFVIVDSRRWHTSISRFRKIRKKANIRLWKWQLGSMWIRFDIMRMLIAAHIHNNQMSFKNSHIYSIVISVRLARNRLFFFVVVVVFIREKKAV